MRLVSVLERAAAVDVAGADRAELCEMFADLARLSAWIDARRVVGFRRLEELPDVLFADVAVAEVTRERARDAQGLQRRTAALEVLPRFTKALEAGEINVGHVDAVTAGLADIPRETRPRFVAAQHELLDQARRLTSDAFTRAVRDTVKRVLSGEDSVTRLRRQQRATRLAAWTSTATGMLHLRGQFDPETGSALVTRLESARRQLFPDIDALPDTCPPDPGVREDYLRAVTLARLLTDSEAPGWRPETLLVVDQHTRDHGYHEQSIVDAGIDSDLPHEAVQRLAARGRTVPVAMTNGVVDLVDGRTVADRGRRGRLASFEQRRALRAMYPTCGIPDCPVRFRDCHIHHIHPWEHGGRTDLCNLLPLCNRHHHAVHDLGWTLQLDPVTRYLTVTRPDGSHTTRPPPYAAA